MVMHRVSGRTATGTSPYEVALLQMPFWSSSHVDVYENLLVATPTAPTSNIWHTSHLYPNGSRTTDGVDCLLPRVSAAMRYYTGQYFGPSVSEYVWPDGAWTETPKQTYSAMYSSSRRLQLDIPPKTTHLYMLNTYAADDRYCTLELSGAGAGELLYNQFYMRLKSAGGDVPMADAGNLQNFVEIARNCGGQRLTLTPHDGSFFVLGFIAITDTPSNPIDGVFDPGSYTEITRTTQHVLAAINLGLDGRRILPAAGGHYTATDTLINYTHKLTYEQAGAEVLWNPPAETLVRQATTQFHRQLYGDLTLDGAGIVGQQSTDIFYTATGCGCCEQFAFNSLAESSGLTLDADYDGGYAGQWGLNGDVFQFGYSVPDIGRTDARPWDGRWLWDRGGNTAMLSNEQYTALFSCMPYFDLADNSQPVLGKLDINSRSDLDFPKLYCSYTRGGFAIKDGDRLGGLSMRTLALRSVL